MSKLKDTYHDKMLCGKSKYAEKNVHYFHIIIDHVNYIYDGTYHSYEGANIVPNITENFIFCVGVIY